jgi:hypothetical protein
MNIKDFESNEKNVENVLGKIHEQQNALMKEYQVIERLPNPPLNLDLYDNQIIIKDFKQRTMEEIAEGIEAFREGDMEHFWEELIDALHFATELNLLVGKDEKFFITTRDIKDTKVKIKLEDLYYHYGKLAEKYGLLCNTLKNKPWKQSGVAVDKDKFYELLKDAFDYLIYFLKRFNLSSDDIYNYYFRKKKVNEFRVRSKY